MLYTTSPSTTPEDGTAPVQPSPSKGDSPSENEGSSDDDEEDDEALLAAALQMSLDDNETAKTQDTDESSKPNEDELKKDESVPWPVAVRVLTLYLLSSGRKVESTQGWVTGAKAQTRQVYPSMTGGRELVSKLVSLKALLLQPPKKQDDDRKLSASTEKASKSFEKKKMARKAAAAKEEEDRREREEEERRAKDVEEKVRRGSTWNSSGLSWFFVLATNSDAVPNDINTTSYSNSLRSSQVKAVEEAMQSVSYRCNEVEVAEAVKGEGGSECYVRWLESRGLEGAEKSGGEEWREVS